jgi:flavodoxin
MSKSLVVYYSYSSTTKKVAEQLARIIKGDIRNLIPQKPYSFNYNTAAKETRNEIQRGYCPPLLAGDEAVDLYDYIFIGTPNWFKSFAPPVLSFLRNVDLKNKIIVPFCTHGGGGMGQIEEQMLKECPQSEFLEGLAVMPEFGEKDMIAWLNKIGVMDKL